MSADRTPLAPRAPMLVDARSTGPARLAPPVSKSDAQRALTLAHARSAPELVALPPEHELPVDVRALVAGLATLRERPAAGATIACHDGGLPFRVLLAQAAVTPGARVRFIGSARLGDRPHRPLVDALGATLGRAGLVIDVGDPWPVTVRGVDEGSDLGVARFTVAATESSQYATSLLCAAAALVMREGRPWTVQLAGAPASPGYPELSLAWLRRMGFDLEERAGAVTVTSARAPMAPVTIPGDWSSLGYLLFAAWRTGATVAGVDRKAAHPDRAVLDVLAQAGLALEERPHGDVAVVGAARAGVRVSGRDCPDLLPTVAALACVLPAPSTLTDVAVLRHKESDRLRGIEELVGAAGGTVTLVDDRLTIAPGRVPAHLDVQGRGDHRMVMAAATLAVLAGVTLAVDDGACVDKSFPGFWRELQKLGCAVTRDDGGGHAA